MATIGETSILSLETNISLDFQYGFRFYLPEDGRFTSMSLYTPTTAGLAFRLCIYDDAAGPVPNNLLAQTVEGTSVVDGWVTVNISGSPVFIPTQWIWLTFHSAEDFRWMRETTGGISQDGNPDTYVGGPEDPWSGGSAATTRASLYATFTSAAMDAAAAFGPQVYAVPPKVVGY